MSIHPVDMGWRLAIGVVLMLLDDCNHAIVSDQTELVTRHLLEFFDPAPDPASAESTATTPADTAAC